MTIENPPEDLKRAINLCAERLQSALIQTTGTNRVAVPPDSALRFSGPAMRPGGEYAGIPMSEFPYWLCHERSFLGMAHIHEVYEEACEEMLAKRSVADFASKYVTKVRFTHESPSSNALAQLICAMWWSSRGLETKLTVGLDRIELKTINSQRIGFDNRSIIRGKNYMRLPSRLICSVSHALRKPIGYAAVSAESTGAVYAALSNALPELRASVLPTIFATAVAAGRDHEKLITQLFDIVEVEGIENDTSMPCIERARMLIKTAALTPNEQLWKLLKGYLTYEQFLKQFGSPTRVKTAYTKGQRDKHMAALDRLDNMRIPDSVEVAPLEQETAEEAQARSLLNLQNLMGQRA